METASGGSAPWINTFADLMNLLLCFFVMLFAFSDVNEVKFEKVALSMANSFGVFEGGGSSIGSGQLINAGVSQLSNLDQFISAMGKTSSQAGLDTSGQSDTSSPTDQQQGNQGSSDSDNSTDNQGSNLTGDSEGKKEIGIDEAKAKINAEMADANAGMYDKLSDLTNQNNLGDSVDLSIDRNNKYVQLTLKGSVLFAPGEADLKKGAKAILSSVGNILKKFDGYNVEITGHTDNVPMKSSKFEDNNWLSSARAIKAAEYLIQTCGMDPATLKYSGRGPYEPISSNATAEGRAKNRRIEIKIYNEYSSE